MDAPKTLPITEAQAGRVLTGFAVSHWLSPGGDYCLVVASEGVCHACRVDRAVQIPAGTSVQLRAVTLAQPPAPAWEVHARRLSSQYELVPGQHCPPRTAPAEQWLQEIEAGLLPQLVAQEEHLRAERSRDEDARQLINPAGESELPYGTALALARKEVLGPAYVRVCRGAQAAEHRSTQAAVAWHIHNHVPPEAKTGRRQPWAWIARWRKGRRLQRHVKQSQAWRLRAEAQRRRLEQVANTPEIAARLEQRARQLQETDRVLTRQLAAAGRAERSALRQLVEAQYLIQYLQRRPGAQVTLHQTAVQGGAPQLPTLPGAPGIPPAWRAQARSIVPVAKTPDGPANPPAAPVPQPDQPVEKPRAKPSGSPHPATTTHTKSNGVRPRF